MDRGEIIAYGTHDELVKVVGELDRIELMVQEPGQAVSVNGKVEQVAQNWRTRPGVQEVSSADGALTLLVDDSNEILPQLFESANQLDVRITSVEIHEPNLEAVFLHLTGRALRD